MVLNELICDCKLATSEASFEIYDAQLVFKVEIFDVLVVILVVFVDTLVFNVDIDDLLTELSASNNPILFLLLVLSPYNKLILLFAVVISPWSVN